MEHGHPVAPSNSVVLDHHPPQAPTTVVGDEEQHHEKKSIMSRVQNKVNKLKHTINKKRHTHDEVSEVPPEEESEELDENSEDMDVSSEVSSTHAVYQSPARDLDDEHEPLITPETVKPHVNDGRDETPVPPETVLDVRHESPVPKDSRHEPPVPPETMKAIPAEVAAVYGSPAASRKFDREHEPLNTPETVKPHVLDGRDETPVTPETVLHGRHEPPVTPETMKAIPADEEPIAPLPYGSVPPTTDDADTSLPTSVGPTPGNESSVPPEVLNSLRAMSLSEQREGQGRDQTQSETQSAPEDETPVNHMSSDMEKPSYTEKFGTTEKPSYTEKFGTTAAASKEAAVSGPTGTPQEGVEKEMKPSYSKKLSSSAFAAKDSAVSAASMVYSKVAGKEGTHSSDTVASSEEGAGEKKGSYTEKLYGTALAAKEAGVMAASTVYGIVVGAGATVMGNVVEPESVREYLAEKLRPGEDDKALCEVISGSMQKGGEEDKVAVEKGRIELPEVTSREVVSDAPAEAVSDAPPAVSDAPAEAVSDAPPAVDAKSGGYTGQGMVEKIRGAVTSLVGGRGGVADAPAAAVEAPIGGTTDSPAVDSSGGGRGEVADTPAAVEEAPSGGAGKERNSEGLGA